MTDAVARAARVPDEIPRVPDEIACAVPRGGRVLVFADLRLVPGGSEESHEATRAVGRAIEDFGGPGVVLFAGDTFDFLGDGRPDLEAALGAHPRLTRALEAFLAAPDRRVVVLPGTRDALLAHECRLLDAAEAAGFEVALRCLLEVDTGRGSRTLRVEPGHQLDPAAHFGDPRDPHDHPLAQHLERDVLPNISSGGADAEWLAGADDVDPAQIGALVASRFAYRRLFRRAMWLTLPVLAGLALLFPFAVWSSRRDGGLWHLFGLLSAGFAVELLLVAAALAFVVTQLRDALAPVSWLTRASRSNDAARGEAVAYAAMGGDGLITAYTRTPEIMDLGSSAFYANCGTAGRVLEPVHTRAGLPTVFAARLRCSWVELEAGAELHARIWHGVRDLPERTWLERMATRERVRPVWPPVPVAEHPGTVMWPSPGDITAQRRRTRRIAAIAIGIAAVLNLVSAVTLPVASRLRALDRLAAIPVPRAAAAVVAICGLGLLFLAQGVRRGQRHAWILANLLLLVTVAGNVVKGLDIEEAIVSLLVIGFLVVHREDFAAPANPSSTRRAFVTLLLGVAVAVAAGTLGVMIRRPDLALGDVVTAVGERLVGITSVPLPDRIDDLVTPVLLAVGIGLALAFGWLLFRPAVMAREESFRPVSRDRARFLVERYGTDSLSYFALRDDKELFGFRDTLVAYGVHNGIALVSPDPIGPVGQRPEAWAAFREFADDHGWPVAIMGASADWLPVYRASGMHELYIGDEAVVDVQRFSLEGKQNKSLRQSVSRVEKLGYRVEFFDPAELPDTLEADLHELMRESRRGDVERGFSMTLGRAFDPADKGLLLAVGFDANDQPAGFCQYVPARAIHGWSLDLMRRSEAPDVPNGLTEFIVAKTIENLCEQGANGLALNFATFRAVLASETGDRVFQRAQKWFLERMSSSMQIESLWTFNEKFQPEWHARYACYDSPEHLVGASIAVARAESFFEIPLIGRFFAPDAPTSAPAKDHPVGASSSR